jgi:pilus assembly protein CpaB
MKFARLVVLGIAVVAGGAAAWLAGRSDQAPPPPVPQPAAQIETADVLVAKNDIAIGRALTPQDIQWQLWPAMAVGPQFIRKTERPAALNELLGSITRTPFAAGEPIREAKLIKANGSGYLAAMLPANMRALSFEISPETGVGGFVLPNDRVDILLTRARKSTNGEEVYTSEIILTNIRVLAIDQTVEEKNGQRTVVGKIATVELTPGQAETLGVARRLGSLSPPRQVASAAAALAGGSNRDGDPRAALGWGAIQRPVYERLWIAVHQERPRRSAEVHCRSTRS